jgi:hypothetical protein
MVALVYAIWTKREAIRIPAVVIGASMAALMGALIERTIFGTPPSTNLGLFFLCNIVDVVAPILILVRVIPQPLFGASATRSLPITFAGQSAPFSSKS